MNHFVHVLTNSAGRYKLVCFLLVVVSRVFEERSLEGLLIELKAKVLISVGLGTWWGK
jgi:hypothetical protein